MSETTATPATTTPSKAKQVKTAAAKNKVKITATHPPVSDMVLAAIKSLKERNGSSSQAIKKYIGVNYKVEVERLQPFIKKYLKSAVTSGALTQTKGKGANGSFKLGANQTKDKKPIATKEKTKPVPKKTPTKKAIKTVVKPSVAPKVKTTAKKEVKPKTKSPKVKKTVEKKSKTPKTTPKSPKKAKAIKPKPAKKTPQKAPQRSTRKV